MKKLTFSLIMALLCLSYNLFSYSTMYIVDPQGMNNTSQVVIDSLTFTVKPQGMYAEVGMYMVFSPQAGYWYQNGDSLELAWYFDMPESAMFIDSWLWFDDYIIQAKHYDRVTGSKMYEDIVRRYRRDPSIVYKNSATSYEVRVFPVLSNGSRKIKLTWLQPFDWTNENCSLNLPVDIFNNSTNQAKVIKFFVYENNEFKCSNLEFNKIKRNLTDTNDETFGECKSSEVIKEKTLTNCVFTFNNPSQNGIYLTTFKGIDENYYQLQCDLNKLNIRENKNLIILIDHSTTGSAIDIKDEIALLKKYLLLNMTEKDSFNIFVSNINIQPVSNKLLPSSKSNIDKYFDDINENTIGGMSNLISLLLSSAEWANSNCENANFVLISSNFDLGYYKVANNLINDLNKINLKRFPYNIIDISLYKVDYHFNNHYYYGNEYLYENLSNSRDGSYYLAESTNYFEIAMRDLTNKLFTYPLEREFQVNIQNGFAYSDVSSAFFPTTNSKFVKIGKYMGDSIFSINYIYKNNNKIERKEFNVNANSMENNYKLSKIWAGNYIKTLETIPLQTKQVVNEIIDVALTNRVLSKYTVFLALEYGDTVYAGTEPDDDGGTNSVTESENGKIKLEAFPNPFVNNLYIKINIDAKNENTEAYITDLMGNVVKRFNNISGNEINLNWDSKTDDGSTVSSGVYMLVLTNGKDKIVLKIIKI